MGHQVNSIFASTTYCGEVILIGFWLKVEPSVCERREKRIDNELLYFVRLDMSVSRV